MGDGGPLCNLYPVQAPASQPSTSPSHEWNEKGSRAPHDRRQIPHPAISFEDASSGYDNKKAADPITWGCPSLESLLNSLDVVFRSDRLGHLHHARPPASFGAWMSLRAYLGQYLLVRLVNELKGARETRALFRRLPGGSQTRRSNCAWAGLVVVSASSETYTATTLSCRLFANCFFISCRR